MNKWYKQFITIFLIVLLLPMVGFSGKIDSTEIKGNFSLPAWILVPEEGGSARIQMPDFVNFPNQQGYLLPRKILSLPIPTEYEYAGIRVISKESVVDSRSIILSKKEKSFIVNSQGKVEASFTGNTPSLLTYVSTSIEKNQKYLHFVLCPFSYQSREKKLTSIQSCTFSVLLNHINQSDSWITSLDVPASEKYEYCIILPRAKVPLFLDYKSFLEERGIRTILYPLEEIYATYHQSNNPTNIRAFLKDFYQHHGIETVLLVGSIGTIPMKQFYPTGSKNEEPVLSDLYYAELSTAWDTPYPGKLETDLKDFDPELAIGRLPMDSDQEIAEYLSRMKTYYQTIQQRKKSVLCAGAWISFQEDEGILFRSDLFDIDGGKMAYLKYKTYFPTYSYEGFYEQDGIKKSLVAGYGNAINYENVKGAIWQTNPLIQLLSGHGNYSAIYRKIWNGDKNENGFAESEEITYDPFYDEKTPSSASIYLVDSCSTCLPDKSNLGIQTIRKSGGGYLGFASEVYFIVTSTCKDPCDFETSTSIYGITGVVAKHLNQQLSLGESIRKSLKHYRDQCFVSLNPTASRYQAINLFATCYYGDPYIRLSEYPKKDFDTFVSQGKGDSPPLAFGIEDVSISTALAQDTIQIKTQDSLQMKKNYFIRVLLDADKDGVTDYSYQVGYQTPGNFTQQFYQRDLYQGIVGHYGFHFETNDFWIQIPRTILGKSYRYELQVTNIETNQSDRFLGSYPKEASPPTPPEKPVNPSPPSSLQAKLVEGRVLLTWSASAAGGFPVTGYEVFRQEEGYDFTIISSQEANSLSFLDQFVVGGKKYHYHVRAFDNQLPKNYSPFSNLCSVILPLVENPAQPVIPPCAPSIIKLQNINTVLYLTWRSSVPGTFSIAGYEIHRQENTESFTLVAMTDATTLYFNDSLVSSGKTYTYKIRCFDNQSPPHYSVFSTDQTISLPPSTTPKDPDPKLVLPPSPPLLKGVFIQDKWLNQLTWSKSLEGTFPIMGYELYRKTHKSAYVLYQKFDAFTTHFFDTSIEGNTTYEYYLIAMDNQSPPHPSLPSNTLSLLVLSPPKQMITIRLKIGSTIAIVGDRFLVLPLEPFTYKGRTMVPIRFISEAFGATVQWTEDESRNGEGVIEIYLKKSDGHEFYIAFHTLESKALLRVYLDGKLEKDQLLTMEVPAFIVKPADRTVVPVRFIAEIFEASVGWDEPNEEIKIEFNP